MLLAFSHIPKTAGTTLNHLLQRHFGHRHISIHYRISPSAYTLRDLDVDMRIHPFAKSLAGHALKAFVDFGHYEDQLRWYTILRDPVKRFISLYQHQINAGISAHQHGFDDWMRILDRRNWMVRWIAGEEDLDAAKQILLGKFQFVGLVEEFDASLLLFRERMGLENFVVDYPAPANTAPSTEEKEKIRDDIERYRSAIEDNNELDVELYRFVVDKIWPRQVTEYGVERLEGDLDREFPRNPVHPKMKCRQAAYLAYRNLIYKPFLQVDRTYLSLSNSILDAGTEHVTPRK